VRVVEPVVKKMVQMEEVGKGLVEEELGSEAEQLEE
jgi:hypothetical protein